jgi:hypothetical protein
MINSTEAISKLHVKICMILALRVETMVDMISFLHVQ